MACPICAKPTTPEVLPFCSRRCADIDLARWLNGSYAIPSDSVEDIAAAAEALEQQPPKPH